MAQRSAMFLPAIVDERASSLRRVPSQSGHVVKVATRSTNARMWGCRPSMSFDRYDFWSWGTSPRYVRLMPSTLIFVDSL
jgi:hypothetical protein